MSDQELKEATNMTAEDELLRWHHRMAHVSMARIQKLAKQGYLPARIATCRIPLCQACVYGKLTRRPWRTKTRTDANDGATPSTFPGQCTSVDQLESPVLGFVGQLKGSLMKKRYKVATIFVDHFSNLSYIHLQSTTNAVETLEAKQEYEKYANTFGIRIIQYHADNGRFAENAWKEDVRKKNQRLTFCGVGAHHQNGRAEKRIRDIQDMARTSLIHASRRWPQAINTHLWPYAIRHANHALNHTPFKDAQRTPIELFSKVSVQPNFLTHHPFGCPVYALDGKIQAGRKAPKWESRARLAINLGSSLQHANTVGLVLSLTTGLVSPQFHLRYDDTFETLHQGAGNVVSMWQQLAGFSVRTRMHPKETPTLPVQVNTPIETVGQDEPIEQQLQLQQLQDVDEDIQNRNEEDDASLEYQVTTRSGRVSRPPRRYEDYVAHSCDILRDSEGDDFESPFDMKSIIAYGASSDPDVLYLHEAMAASDKAEFLKAMDKEVQSHTDNKNWEMVDRDQVPPGHKVLPAIWAMRRKREISTQKVYKWKARLNIHGGKQVKGVNYWDTYAPVASWTSIRLVLIIATIKKWKTKQLDFVLAFPQAPVETDLYMEIPAGFRTSTGSQTKVLKLINNLYGQKQAGRVWNLFLSDGLKTLGFIQSEHDPCIFWKNTVIIIIFTDDTIITGPIENDIDNAINTIGNKFQITNKETVDDFLGVKVQHDVERGSITFTQPHLINTILNDLSLDSNSNSRNLPALTGKVLQKFPSSTPHDKDEWHYRSLIGKLNYLEKSTIPELAYAVHQCARFSSQPKVEHSKAVKLIGRYLLGSAEKGIEFMPKDKSFECFCDADFAGNWDVDAAETDTSTARSRSGYIIFYAGCPILWASRQQTEIALSSTESEYISLSQALREVVPLMRLVNELKLAGFNIHCKAFEDNNGALEMAKVHKMRPRTKHLNIKYHHFREAVVNKEISIWSIDTKDQVADIFTKPFGMELFMKFRQAIMGW